MYSDIFCKVYNEFGWNYYPEVFGEALLRWLRHNKIIVRTSMDLACGTGILCQLLQKEGIEASGMDLSEGMIRLAREQSSGIHFEAADMTTYRPCKTFDLVTCTGDAINHVADLSDVERIFQNVYAYTADGGYFVFDLLNEKEVSDSEPFEMDFTETQRVWFQMTRPAVNSVNLKIRIFERGILALEENIFETIHDPAAICDLLEKSGFSVVQCADHLLSEPGHRAKTWYVIAQKTKQE